MLVPTWYLVIGVLLIAMALLGSSLRPLPVSTAMLYLAAGALLGPWGTGLIGLDPYASAAFLERFSEFAVIVSLFTSGLMLRVSLSDRRWWLPLRLAFGSMAVTVGLIAIVGTVGLGLPPGAAILLGAILAPTDPVLASDVQVDHPADRDQVRFALTGEAGLNDGAAFPFVMLGLGLLGLHPLGQWGWRWLTVDVVWAIVGGLAIGGLVGLGVARLVLYLRRTHAQAVGHDDFLAMGLIALAYGAALLAHSYGFLAVFAAGLALRRVERHETGPEPPEAVQDPAGTDVRLATSPETAAAYMTEAVLIFNEQLGRIGELGVVLLLGGMLATAGLPIDALWFVPLLFLAIRPAAVTLGLIGAGVDRPRRILMSWFGIRGIGSIYYLTFAIGQGLPEPVARRLSGLTLAAVAASIVVHGVSVTPLMARYRRFEDHPEPGLFAAHEAGPAAERG